MERGYTCNEVAVYYRVTIATVYEWIRQGRLPALKIGKRYIITPEHLAQFEKAAG